MGEASRRAMQKKVVDDVTKKLVDEGKLIEAGWFAYRKTVLPADASEIQINETRMAFFAGAQHLFGSMMSFLEPGDEPTQNDTNRMTMIHNELQAFVADFSAKHLKTQGSA